MLLWIFGSSQARYEDTTCLKRSDEADENCYSPLAEDEFEVEMQAELSQEAEELLAAVRTPW